MESLVSATIVTRTTIGPLRALDRVENDCRRRRRAAVPKSCGLFLSTERARARKKGQRARCPMTEHDFRAAGNLSIPADACKSYYTVY